MLNRIKLLAAGLALAAGSGLAAPAHAVDFLGIPLWESYPGQYSYAPYYYAPPPAYYYYYYDPYTGRYYRRY